MAVLVVAATLGCSPTGDAPASVAEGAPPPVLATKLVVGVSSYYGENAASAMRPLVAHLSKVLGLPVELRVAEPYKELPRLLRTKVVDVAQLPPLAYVRVRDAFPGVVAVATPIIGGSPTYLGHIYVRAESSYRDLADLQGKRIGYVSRDSSSGYLFARDLVRRKGFEPDSFFGPSQFYRSHPQVLAAVLAGEVEAGAAFDATSDWTGPIDRPEGLRVLAKTERIPNDCLVGREGVDPGLIVALRRALLRLRPGDPVAEQVLQSMHINGWVAADEPRYDRVRAVLARESAATLAAEGATERTAP